MKPTKRSHVKIEPVTQHGGAMPKFRTLSKPTKRSHGGAIKIGPVTQHGGAMPKFRTLSQCIQE